MLDVNYLAVLVVGVVLFMLGGLWYSPLLFAKKWMGLIDKSEEDLRKASSPVNYILVFLGELITAYVLALVVGWAGATSALAGAHVGLLCWAGLAGATSFMTYTFSARPRALWAIDTGYNLVSFVLGCVILSLWR